MMTPENIAATLIHASQGFDWAMRRLNPLALTEIREDLLVHLEPLAATRQFLLATGPGAMDESVRDGLLHACDFLLGAIRNFANEEDLQAAFIAALRSARKHCRAQEALFALCGAFPEVDRYFQEEGATALLPFDENTHHNETGIIHAGSSQHPHARGGYSLYIPETYMPKQSRPMIVALHGGYSHGRDFLWTWLSFARSWGYVLFAPTSAAMTWSISNVEIDGQPLHRNLEEVCSRVNIDRERILLTGMSDGGTYALALALTAGSIFQTVVPVACALPPVDLAVAKGKRIFWIHGTQDWIFPLSYAVESGKKLYNAGADIKMKVVSDLSHTYPREENSAILKWFETP